MGDVLYDEAQGENSIFPEKKLGGPVGYSDIAAACAPSVQITAVR